MRAQVMIAVAACMSSLRCVTVDAKLYLPGVFNDSMVIQLGHADLGISAGAIFGMAYTNETVVIEGSEGFPIQKQTIKPVATGPAYWAEPFDAPWGNWSLQLPAPADVTKNYSVTVSILEDQSDRVTINDVVFGEIIIYAGQSNMELACYQTDCHLVPMPEVAGNIRLWYNHGNLSLDGTPMQTLETAWIPKVRCSPGCVYTHASDSRLCTDANSTVVLHFCFSRSMKRSTLPGRAGTLTIRPKASSAALAGRTRLCLPSGSTTPQAKCHS